MLSLPKKTKGVFWEKKSWQLLTQILRVYVLEIHEGIWQREVRSEVEESRYNKDKRCGGYGQETRPYVSMPSAIALKSRLSLCRIPDIPSKKAFAEKS
jgi:hypothetical protein